MTVDIKKVDKVVEKEYQDIISDYANVYGMWINVLWGLDDGELETVEEKREAFLLLLKKLIDAGLVKVLKPGADVYYSPSNPNPKYTIRDPEVHWDIPSEEIIAWFRRHWPKGIRNPNDVELTYFFYECPGIIWKDPETGEWVGS